MALMPLHHDRIPALRRQRFPDRVLCIEGFARLILIRHLQRLGMIERAGIGRYFAQQQAHQRCLARPVWPDNADPVTPQDAQVQIFRNDEVSSLRGLIGFREALGLDHLLAERVACIRRNRC